MAGRRLRDTWRAAVESAHSGGRFRRRLTAALGTAENPYAGVSNALRESVTDRARQYAGDALRLVAERWNSHPAAASVAVTQFHDLPRDFSARADAVAVSWLGTIEAGRGARPDPAPVGGRWSPEALAIATLAVAGETDDPVGPAALARSTLTARAQLPDPSALDDVRQDLGLRLARLIGEEQQRLADVLDRARVSPTSVAGLRAQLESLDRLKHAFTA